MSVASVESKDCTTADEKPTLSASTLTEEAQNRCPICFEVMMIEPCTLACGHSFCRGCILRSMLSPSDSRIGCPVCRSQIDGIPKVCIVLRQYMSNMNPTMYAKSVQDSSETVTRLQDRVSKRLERDSIFGSDDSSSSSGVSADADAVGGDENLPLFFEDDGVSDVDVLNFGDDDASPFVMGSLMRRVGEQSALEELREERRLLLETRLYSPYHGVFADRAVFWLALVLLVVVTHPFAHAPLTRTASTPRDKIPLGTWNSTEVSSWAYDILMSVTSDDMIAGAVRDHLESKGIEGLDVLKGKVVGTVDELWEDVDPEQSLWTKSDSMFLHGQMAELRACDASWHRYRFYDESEGDIQLKIGYAVLQTYPVIFRSPVGAHVFMAALTAAIDSTSRVLLWGTGRVEQPVCDLLMRGVPTTPSTSISIAPEGLERGSAVVVIRDSSWYFAMIFVSFLFMVFAPGPWMLLRLLLSSARFTHPLGFLAHVLFMAPFALAYLHLLADWCRYVGGIKKLREVFDSSRIDQPERRQAIMDLQRMRDVLEQWVDKASDDFLALTRAASLATISVYVLDAIGLAEVFGLTLQVLFLVRTLVLLHYEPHWPVDSSSQVECSTLKAHMLYRVPHRFARCCLSWTIDGGLMLLRHFGRTPNDDDDNDDDEID